MMEKRRERKNVIEFVDNQVIRKISMVRETVRLQRLEVEAWALTQVKARGINVPRVVDYYRNARNQEVLVLERIYGRPLSLCNPKEKTEALVRVGPQMVTLNNIAPNFGWINPITMQGDSVSWRLFISTYTQTYCERLVNNGILNREDASVIYRLIQDIDIDLSDSFLLNRDFRLSHFFLDNSDKVWILDWENVILGDPLYDLAIFAVRYGEGILCQNLQSGYNFEYLLLKYSLYKIIALIGIIDYCRKSGIDYSGKIKKLIKLISSLQGS